MDETRRQRRLAACMSSPLRQRERRGGEVTSGGTCVIQEDLSEPDRNETEVRRRFLGERFHAEEFLGGGGEAPRYESAQKMRVDP